MRIKKLFVVFIFIFLIIFSNTYVNVSNASDAPSISTGSVYLMDTRTTRPLYTRNENTKMYPASTTKIMTAIIALENCDLDEVVTASYDALSNIPEGYTVADIQVGEQLTVEQLLELLLVHSANDAANVLAKYVGGSLESFVSMMNTKLNELGLNDTHFTNAYGLQDDNHYTTAKDMAFLMKYCLQNETFRKISGQASCAIPATNMSAPRKYDSTNQLLIAGNEYYYQYVFSGKTGFTTEAKHCLVTAAYNNDLELICVVLGNDDRFNITRELYEYAFSNYELKNVINENDVVTNITVENASNDTKSLDLLIAETIPALVETNVDTELIPIIDLNSNISAPIYKGDVLGKVTYSINGVNYTTNLIASHDVEKSNVKNYLILALIILIIIVIIWIMITMKKRKTKLLEDNLQK